MSTPIMTITTEIPSRSLKVLEFYAAEFCLPVTLLMESECCNKAACVQDDPFQMLARMDKQRPFDNRVGITLEFPPIPYAFLVRVAGLLRRPLEEMLGDFLVESAAMLAAEMSESPQISEGSPDPDLKGWARLAREYHSRARQNLAPEFGCGKKKDCWEWCGISPEYAPEKRTQREKCEA